MTARRGAAPWFVFRATSLPGKARHAARVAAAVGLAALLAPRLGYDPPYPWNFRDPESHAYTYRQIARRHLGNGIFYYASSQPRGHIRMCEIGMVGYFSGASVWLADVCGLAQPGELGTRSMFLAHLFPASSLHTIRNEYAEVRRLTGERLEPGPIYAVGSGALARALKVCSHVVVEPRICMSF